MHPVRRYIHKAATRIKATPEERVRRLSICEGCEWATTGQFGGEDFAKCGHCGCPLAFRTKFKLSKCPKGKW